MIDMELRVEVFTRCGITQVLQVLPHCMYACSTKKLSRMNGQLSGLHTKNTMAVQIYEQSFIQGRGV